MITNTILLIFLGCFITYNTSKKVELFLKNSIITWMKKNRVISNIFGGVLIGIALFLLISHFGTTSGILFWLVILMTTLSLIIVIAPLKRIHYKHLLMFFLLLLIFEYTL